MARANPFLAALGGAFMGKAAQNEQAFEQEQKRQAAALQQAQFERLLAADKRGAAIDLAKLLDAGYTDAASVSAPSAKERAAPSVLDAVVQPLADARVKGAIDFDGRKLVAPGETSVQRAERLRLEQGEDKRRETEANNAFRQSQLAETSRHNRAMEGAELSRIAVGRQPGVGTPRAPTEAQEKSYIYYGLMSNATDRMNELGFVPDPQTGKMRPNPKIRPWAIKAALGLWGGNAALNAKEQEYLRSARDFAAGVLRKESGAAIKDDELRDVFARFVDAPFDEAGTREVKSAARKRYMDLMANSARPATLYYDAVTRGGLPSETRPDPTNTSGGYDPRNDWPENR